MCYHSTHTAAGEDERATGTQHVFTEGPLPAGRRAWLQPSPRVASQQRWSDMRQEAKPVSHQIRLSFDGKGGGGKGRGERG